jgi:D-glycero-D-manno-heptose 1,7-bisphosphate phosphatase
MNSKTAGNVAVFLDRDGTVCEEVGYLSDEKELRLIPGAAEAIIKINQAGWKVIIISNQSGIARGYMNSDDVDRVNQKLLKLLKAEGAQVDGIYYCPHHPQGNSPYNIKCDCRKPEAGLLYKAAREHKLILDKSIMIGDKYSDVETAIRLNIPGILVRTGFGEGEVQKYEQLCNQTPDYIARDLSDAIEWWFNSISNSKDRQR